MSTFLLLKCQKCDSPFNLSSREPLLISCCNDTVCKKCWEGSFNIHDGRFLCPYKCYNQESHLENPQNPK